MTQQQQPPAIVFIARHGPRLDAADQSWHLSTPTPYDPPITYGGWNQCRSLGIRIASILHAREQTPGDGHKEPAQPKGTKSHDFAMPDGAGVSSNGILEQGTRKRKRKTKVVIHSSPFLRCLQSSVAIAAGMAQFQPPDEAGGKSGTASRTKSSVQMHSAPPRSRGSDGIGSPSLAPILEPKRDLARTIARKALHEHRRYRKAKLRVDAFLGEWLNPQYFDQITPPPPSPMMVTAAKVELLQSETIDIFTPAASTKSSTGSLWGSVSHQRSASSENALEDCGPLDDAQPASGRRDRSTSVSSVGSNESGSGRKSPFRPGHVLQPSVSTVPKPEVSVYVPPTPQYAVSSSDHIPRGYVTHARQACTNTDYQWDSSRPPQAWGDGGEYGEEWSAMHKRFRKGLNHLVAWYSEHNADDRAEDALGIEQAEKHHEDEEEEVVLILVTHGAGSNALIGALTGQPVLLDVGMASLTMAVRRDDAPPLDIPQPVNQQSGQETDPNLPVEQARQGSQLDLGLNSVYEMKLVSSSDHLRPSVDPTRLPTSWAANDARSGVDARAQYRQRAGPGTHAAAGATVETLKRPMDPSRGSSNSNLGSMRRPSLMNTTIAPPGPGSLAKSQIIPTAPQGSATGLWSPVTAKAPQLSAQTVSNERTIHLGTLNQGTGRTSPRRDLVLDFSTSPPDSRPTSSSGPKREEVTAKPDTSRERDSTSQPNAMAIAMNGTLDGAANGDQPNQIPTAGTSPPAAFGRSLSQRGLWGTAPGGDKVARRFPMESKRRWTVNQNNAAAH